MSVRPKLYVDNKKQLNIAKKNVVSLSAMKVLRERSLTPGADAPLAQKTPPETLRLRPDAVENIFSLLP